MDGAGSFYGVPNGRSISVLPRVGFTQCGPALTSVSRTDPHQIGWLVYVRWDRHILWKLVYPQPYVDTLVGSNHTDRGSRIHRLMDPPDRFNRTTTINLQVARLVQRIDLTDQFVNSELHS